MKFSVIPNTEGHPGHSNGILLLDVKAEEALPSEVSFAGGRYAVKDEFHVTLLSRAHGVKKFLDTHPDQILRYMKLVADFYHSVPRVTLVPEKHSAIWHVAKDYEKPKPHVRETLVVSCVVPEVFEFYRHLKVEFGIDVANVPMHITLYTAMDKPGSEAGIGLPCWADFEQLAKMVMPYRIPDLAPHLV